MSNGASDINRFSSGDERFDPAAALMTALEEIDRLKSEVIDLKAQLDAKASGTEHEFNGVYKSIDKLRDRLDSIEGKDQVKAQPKQVQRADLLRDIIKANDGLVTGSVARKRLGISKSAFSLLLKTMDDIDVSKSKMDGRDRILRFKLKLGRKMV